MDARPTPADQPPAPADQPQAPALPLEETGSGASKVSRREARDATREGSIQHGKRVEERREGDATDPDLPQRGMPRMLVILLGLAASWVAIQGMSAYKDLIAPIFLALNFIIAAYPLKDWLTRHGVPEWIGSILAGITVFAALFAFFGSLGWSVSALVTELPQYRDKFTEMYDQSIRMLSQVGVSEAQLEKQLKGLDPKSLMGYGASLLASLQNITGLLAVVVTVLFFLMMDATGWASRMDIARRHHPRVVEALAAFGVGVRRYWIVSSVFGLIVAALDWAALMALGVPLAAVWAVLSFLTNYIPNIGFVIGLVPPALMALLAKGPMTALWVVVAYCVLNFVVQSIIQPKFAGDAVGVTPTLSFVSLLFWATTLGAMGAILALPMTLLLKAILIDSDPRARWANAFIASDRYTAETAGVRETVDPSDADDTTRDRDASRV